MPPSRPRAPLPRSVSQPGLTRGLPQAASRQPRAGGGPAPWQNAIRTLPQHSRLPSVGSGEGSRPGSRPSSRPGSATRSRSGSQQTLASGTTAVAVDTSVEVLRIGKWSVRKVEARNAGSNLIYMHMPTGHAQDEPPPEVLEELDMSEEPKEPAATEADDASGFPTFRRIVLGSKDDVPLTMARDLLEALHEDVGLWDSVQQKFSDFPSEPPLQLDELLKTMDMDDLTIDPGEVSDIINSKIGVQILMRVA